LLKVQYLIDEASKAKEQRRAALARQALALSPDFADTSGTSEPKLSN
jgi:hypothetical protein